MNLWGYLWMEWNLGEMLKSWNVNKAFDRYAPFKQPLFLLNLAKFVFLFVHDQARAVVAGFTGSILTLAPQMTRSKLFATWKLSVEVGL